MTASVDFQAVNARGLVLATFADLDLAKAYVRERAVEIEGLHVVEVTVLRRPIYRPRLRLVGAA